MWIVHGEGPWFLKRFGDSVDDVGLEKVKVQLGLSARVEGESVNLAFHFSVLGSVAVILGARGTKLDDVIPGFQFAGKLVEIITRDNSGLQPGGSGGQTGGWVE